MMECSSPTYTSCDGAKIDQVTIYIMIHRQAHISVWKQSFQKSRSHGEQSNLPREALYRLGESVTLYHKTSMVAVVDCKYNPIFYSFLYPCCPNSLP